MSALLDMVCKRYLEDDRRARVEALTELAERAVTAVVRANFHLCDEAPLWRRLERLEAALCEQVDNAAGPVEAWETLLGLLRSVREDLDTASLELGAVAGAEGELAALS